MLKQRDPAVQNVLREIQFRIERGHYQAGTWLPTERDLSDEFALQRAGIRAVLASLADQGLIVRTPGRRPWVADRRATTEVPDSRLDRAAKLQSIAAILPQHNLHSASLAILGGMHKEIRRLDGTYRLVVYNNCDVAADVDIEQERSAMNSALQDRAAGVILWSMDTKQTLPEVIKLRECGVPVVFIDRYSVALEADFVGVDNRSSAQEAVQYLLDLGHTQIAFVGDDECDITTTTRDRYAGYIEALQHRGLFRPEFVVMMPRSAHPESGAADYLMGLKQRPTAVFANNDATAYLLIEELEKRGIKIPAEMSVIGFDDQDRFSPRRARLTTMQQPFETMGRRAVDLVCRRIEVERDGAWRHVLLPTPLIVRETCARLA